MALLNAVVIKSKEAKDGRNKVRISVAHNGETRYIVTDIILNSSKEFKNGAVVKRPDAAMLNVKIRSLLQRYQSNLDELEYIEGLNCAELVHQIKNAGNYKHRTLGSIYEEYISTAQIKESTAIVYKRIWNMLSKHLEENMLIERINYSTILSLNKFFRDRGTKSSSIRSYITFFITLVNYAKRCGYVQFRRDPFFGYHLPALEIRESWLTVDEIKAIRDLKTTKRNINKCRDFFMLSYYLGGINIIDLLDINFNDNKDTLCYVRKKTENIVKLNKSVEFRIPAEAKEIIKKWKGEDGRLNVSEYQRNQRMRKFFDDNMKLLAEAAGIKKLIYYSARKSFSQHAFDLGIGTNVIDYILGHSINKGGTSLYHYIYVTPKMATDAISGKTGAA